MLDFLKRKKKTPTWNELSDEQRRKVTGRIVKTIKAMSGARYRITSGTDQYQREMGQIERKGEDGILDHAQRGRLLDMARNAVRNNATFATILHQFDLQGVGNEGGKSVITFKDRDFSKEVRERIADWTRSCEFYDGLNLNTCLKLILRTYIIGGDMVILFDDGLVEDSGKILIFEPDEIGNAS